MRLVFSQSRDKRSKTSVHERPTERKKNVQKTYRKLEKNEKVRVQLVVGKFYVLKSVFTKKKKKPRLSKEVKLIARSLHLGFQTGRGESRKSRALKAGSIGGGEGGARKTVTRRVTPLGRT